MKVIKRENEFGLIFTLETFPKRFTISFGGTLDLYWSINNIGKTESNECNYEYFIINKENYKVYQLFETLFYEIENIEIFEFSDGIPLYLCTEEEKKLYLKQRMKEVEEEKKRYRLYNKSNYNELFDPSSKTITWYSDETSVKVANFLKIRKIEDIFKIEFHTQQSIKGYESEYNFLSLIPIRFRNSGSRYNPFNQIFMKMYKSLESIDDIDDEGHQIHIEEYLFNQEKTKRLTR